MRRTQEFLKLSALRRTMPSKRTLWYTLAPLKRFGLSTSLLFVLRNPRFDYSLNQCGFQRLVYGEADGPFGSGFAKPVFRHREATGSTGFFYER